MDVRELLYTPLMKGARLLAGEEGLKNTVTWCALDNIIDFGSWIMPGTLVLYTGTRQSYDLEREITFCEDQGVSGILLLNTPTFLAGESIERCNSENIPVIKLPDSTNLINFTRRISMVLSDAANMDERREEWLKDFVYAQGYKTNEIVATYYGWDGSYDYFCLVLQIKALQNSVYSNYCLMDAESVAMSVLLPGMPRILSFVDKDKLVSFIPVNRGEQLSAIKKLADRISDAVERNFPTVQFKASIGNAVNTYQDIPSSFYNTMRVRAFADSLGLQENPLFYDDYSLEMLFLSSSGDGLIKRATRVLGPIKSDPELMRTLKTYLDEGEGLRRTANKLYIHPSSLRYRIQKIERMTSCDLSEVSVRFRLRLALLVADYFNGEEAKG